MIKKKILAATLSAALIAGSFYTAPIFEVSASNKNSNKDSISVLNTEDAFPIVTEPITLKVMVSQTSLHPPFEEIYVMQEYEKMTGIKIDWNNVPSDELTEKRGLAFASNDLPDIFLKTNIPPNDIYKYGDEGMLINLSPYLEEYAPNFSKIMEDLPQVKQGVPGPDGSIYALPVVFNCVPVNAGVKLFLNGTWIDELDMELPTTTDELYELLVAFKESDPNGNGEADEIPLASDNISNVMKVLNGAFGISNMGAANSNFDIDPETGDVRYYKTSEGYKQMLEYMNRLYTEGLLAREVFTYKYTDLVGLSDGGRLGGFPAVNVSSRANTSEKDYVALGEALEGPEGFKFWGDVRAQTGQRGAFAITNVNKYPEASLRWCDYFYSEEGAVMVYLGIEGVTYEKTDDGYEYLDSLVADLPAGATFDSVIAKYVPFIGGGMPVLTNEKVFKGGEMDPVPAAGSYALVPYFPEVTWPAFSFSIEENEEMARYQIDINKYADQAAAEFVNGSRSLDSFDSYVADIEKMGLEQYIEVFQGVVDRVMK